MNSIISFIYASLPVLAISAAIATATAGVGWYEYSKSNRKRRIRDRLLRFRATYDMLREYCDCWGMLPPRIGLTRAGQPGTSWRYLVAYHQDNPNQAVTSPPTEADWQAPELRACRESARYPFCPASNDAAGDTMLDTNIVTIGGAKTFLERGFRIEKLQPHLIALIEIRSGRWHWMQPGDFDHETAPVAEESNCEACFSNDSGKSFCICFADGEVWCLSGETPYSRLKNFFTNELASQHDREAVLGGFRVA